MTERDRMLQLRDGLRTQGFVADVAPDHRYGGGSPNDVIACSPGGLYWAIEGKLTNIPCWTSQMQVLHPRMFKPGQLLNLLAVAKQGGRASIVLYIEPPRSAEARAWILSARCVAARFQRDQVFRLSDLLGPHAEAYELVRLPRSQWGLKPEMLAKIALPASPFMFEGLTSDPAPDPTMPPST